jgi:hypothetical protein
MEFREGVYWIDEIRDVAFTAKNLFKEQQSLRDYFRPYVNPHVLAIFDRKDIRPFVRRVTSYKPKKHV